jgi:hypothetical protein
MSKTKTPATAKPETRLAAGLKGYKAAKTAALKDADLDKVAGGLNPQPLPPGYKFDRA